MILGSTRAFACSTVLATTKLSLPTASWTSLSSAIEAPAGQYQFSDPEALNYPLRFYRVRSP
jgi:hypothetical protein